MMSSRCLYAGRAIFYGYQALTNDRIMKTPTKNVAKELAKTSAIYAMDSRQGIAQQKEAVMTHIITQSFNIDDIFCVLKQFIPCLTYDSDLTVDLRVLKEIPVILELYLKYKIDITNIHITGDKFVTKFSFKTQVNPDTLVTIKTKQPEVGDIIDNIFKLKTKTIPLDEKGGMGMFENVTKGTMGLITYDINFNNVQVTNEPITSRTLLEYNIKRLNGISNGLKHDFLDTTPYKPIFNKYRPLLVEALDTYQKNYPKVFLLHDTIQNELWSQIQCDPNYNRSISLLFIKQVEEPEYNPQFDAFHKEFVSLLGDKFYNLDKRGDRQEITRAMLLAYNKQVDPLLLKKLHYLQHEAKISFNSIFLQDLLKTFQT